MVRSWIIEYVGYFQTNCRQCKSERIFENLFSFIYFYSTAFEFRWCPEQYAKEED